MDCLLLLLLLRQNWWLIISQPFEVQRRENEVIMMLVQ